MKLAIDFILVVGIATCLLILFLLLKNGAKSLHKKILLIYFLYTLFVITHAYAVLHNLKYLFELTFIFDFTIIWLLGPLLMVYVKSIFQKQDGSLLRVNFYHFIPLFLVTAFVGIPILISFYVHTLEIKYLSFLEKHQNIYGFIRNIYFTGYIVFTLRLLLRYKKEIKNAFSGIAETDLDWIRNLLYGCLIFISIDTALFFLDAIFPNLGISYVTVSVITFITIYLGYNGIGQSKILLPDFLVSKNEIQKKGGSKTHSLSHYKSDDIEALKIKLNALMNDEKVYLDPQLSLNDLANLMELTDKKMSSLFNNYLNTTFYDYINAHRVEEVKRILKTKKSITFTLLSIALDAGFNSKASFNRIFKKETGISPTQFRKSMGKRCP